MNAVDVVVVEDDDVVVVVGGVILATEGFVPISFFIIDEVIGDGELLLYYAGEPG